MKIAIITSPERKEKDLPLLEEAKDIFGTALLIPIDSIKLEIRDKLRVVYKKTDLSDFDVILPIPTFEQKELYYMCLKILEKYAYVPIHSKEFFLMWNKPLLMKAIQKNNMKVRKTFVVASSSTANNVIEQLKIPVIVNPSSKNRILVGKKDTLKGVMSLFKPGYMVRLEKPIKPESNIWCFVVGDDIIASYEIIKGNRRSTNVGKDVRTLVRKIVSIIESDFCIVNLIKTKRSFIVNNVSLTPDFDLFNKITGKNVTRSLLSHLKTEAELEKMPLIQKVFVEVQDFFKRIVKI